MEPGVEEYGVFTHGEGGGGGVVVVVVVVVGEVDEVVLVVPVPVLELVGVPLVR